MPRACVYLVMPNSRSNQHGDLTVDRAGLQRPCGRRLLGAARCPGGGNPSLASMGWQLWVCCAQLGAVRWDMHRLPPRLCGGLLQPPNGISWLSLVRASAPGRRLRRPHGPRSRAREACLHPARGSRSPLDFPSSRSVTCPIPPHSHAHCRGKATKHQWGRSLVKWVVQRGCT